ncbi:hypothetical protein VTN00DRAFT_2436 [Thermoascus crustaceus]|uniref:uncharacterized protein n=1 Tax=Thermoascus crustaceus TaxID=5088 RepID=UPI003744A351
MATPAFGDYISRKQVHQVCWKFLIPKVLVDGEDVARDTYTEQFQRRDRESRKGTSQARENAIRLATGHGDLVVLLLEPSDKAEDVSYDEMVDASPTLRHVDGSLRLAFDGQRSLENAVVLDMRTVSEQEDLVLASLRPDVVLVCQCDARSVENNDFATTFCSSVRRSGELQLRDIDGHKLIKINSFHPMHFLPVHGRDQRVDEEDHARAHLFDATFLVAANALAGRQVSGFGLYNLATSALDGPAGITSTGFSYQWQNKMGFISEEILQLFEKTMLGFNGTKVDKLLSTIGQKHDEVVYVSDVNESSGDLKEDVFERLGHMVPKSPRRVVHVNPSRRPEFRTSNPQA